MDQDVEAILNASDSEEDDNLNVQGVSLEDILREDDDGDYDGDNDHSTYYSGGGGAALGASDPQHLLDSRYAFPLRPGTVVCCCVFMWMVKL